MHRSEDNDVKDDKNTSQETYSGLSGRFLLREQERDLTLRARAGDIEARNEGVETLKDFAYKIATSVHRRYQGTSRENSMSVHDLAQEGLCAALKGFDKFEPDMGYRFSTYFEPVMRREMEAMFSRTSLFGPRTARIFKSNNAKAAKGGGNGVPWMYLISSFQKENDEEQESYSYLIDSESYKHAKESQDSLPEENVLNSEEKELLSQAICSLGEREQTVIRETYYESRTFKEIACELGLTGQRVHQIKNEALGKLRNRMQGGCYLDGNEQGRLEYFVGKND